MEHVVVIYVKDCEARVVPGQLVAIAGDTVKFHAINTEATVLFSRTYADAKEFPVTATPLGRGGVERVYLPPSLPEGIYPYAVHCTANNSFAKGASDPVILIRRQA